MGRKDKVNIKMTSRRMCLECGKDAIQLWNRPVCMEGHTIAGAPLSRDDFETLVSNNQRLRALVRKLNAALKEQNIKVKDVRAEMKRLQASMLEQGGAPDEQTRQKTRETLPEEIAQDTERVAALTLLESLERTGEIPQAPVAPPAPSVSITQERKDLLGQIREGKALKPVTKNAIQPDLVGGQRPTPKSISTDADDLRRALVDAMIKRRAVIE